MNIKIGEDFELSKDRYNWTLGEIRVTPKMTYVVNTYHANLKQVANKMMKLHDTSAVEELYELADIYEFYAAKIAEDLMVAVSQLEKRS